jgi:hypothetical protein
LRRGTERLPAVRYAERAQSTHPHLCAVRIRQFRQPWDHGRWAIHHDAGTQGRDHRAGDEVDPQPDTRNLHDWGRDRHLVVPGTDARANRHTSSAGARNLSAVAAERTSRCFWAPIATARHWRDAAAPRPGVPETSGDSTVRDGGDRPQHYLMTNSTPGPNC